MRRGRRKTEAGADAPGVTWSHCPVCDTRLDDQGECANPSCAFYKAAPF